MKRKVLQLIASFTAILLGAILAFIVATNQRKGADADFTVVAADFPTYDFVRAITGAEKVSMLVPAGADLHDYEPTVGDFKKVENSKVVVAVGGESEKWLERLLADYKGEVIKIRDFIEDAGEDEHIWTSPKNVITIVQELPEKLSKINPESAKTYQENADKYIGELKKLDADIRGLIKKSERKILAFADKFPFQAFVKEYGLDFVSAFEGCAEEAEPSAKKVAALIDEVKTKAIPVVLKLEQSADEIAETVAKETGAKILTLNSAHSISSEDFKSGKTYLDIWHENLAVLKEALGEKGES